MTPTAFRGTYEHALDAKHRLTIPSRFRAVLSGDIVLAASHETTPGSPRSVGIWPAAEYAAYTSQVLGAVSPISPQARELKRFFNANAFDSTLDSANRVMIPTPLIRYADLDKDVVVIGSGDFLEVFDRAAYEGYGAEVLTRIPDIAASLGDTA